MKRLLMWCWSKADDCIDELIVEIYCVNLPFGARPLGSARSKMLFVKARMFKLLRNAVAWAIHYKLGVDVSTNDYLCYLLEKRK